MLLKGHIQKVTLAIWPDDTAEVLEDAADDKKKGLFKVEIEERFRN